jgi:hypothetical protein
MTQNCPLCDSSSKVFYQNSSTYYRCKTCYGIFVDEALRPDSTAEKLRYEIHENNVEDKGYQKFVAPITSSIMKDFSKNDKGLDFGAGTGSAISKVLQDNDFNVLQYDPYFHDYPELLEEKYNYIACCEVIEHFYNPNKEFLLLHDLLEENGKLYCMTNLYDDSIDFATWYYKNDPTHVFFYQYKTIEWIKEEFGFLDVSIEKRLITFTN